MGLSRKEFIANHEDTVGDSLVLYMKDRQERLNKFVDDEIGTTTKVQDSRKSYWSSEGAAAGRRANIGLGDRLAAESGVGFIGA